MQDYLNRALARRRAEVMKTSPQLTLGTLIAQLEAIQDKTLPVRFDDRYHPTDIDSWRGSYEELALEYAEEGPCLSVAQLLSRLRCAVGETFIGYKGGEYVMGVLTPVWVANYGESRGFRTEGNVYTQAVTGVSHHEASVIIDTQNIEY